MIIIVPVATLLLCLLLKKLGAPLSDSQIDTMFMLSALLCVGLIVAIRLIEHFQ